MNPSDERRKRSRTSWPHIHIEDHKMTRKRVLDGNVSETIDGINRFGLALHFAVNSVINTVSVLRVVVNVKSESQPIGEFTLFDVGHNTLQLFQLHHNRNTHRPKNQAQ